jgi:site-specific DNA recombinase
MIRFAFLGRVSTEDQQDPEASRNWQRARAQALVERHGSIVAEFFDVGQSRSIPWKRRPRASQLLTALKDPDRGFEAVVIGEPQRAFYGNQYGLTFPVFAHYGVGLWVPEVGGPIDPESEAHDLVMSVFGGMSKGERTRIKVRVRAAMAAQASIEGRYLGGRPPYGYQLADAGPHPNPAKAADGKRLHRLEPDPAAAPVILRIFTEYLSGRGIYAIAEGLTRDDIACPSAHDPDRNRHRSGLAWSKPAIRAILTNPRYTGRQVWNKQRKDEVLIDVEDVALGHQTQLRWNDREKWIWSEQIVHEPLIDADTFGRAQVLLAARGASRTTRERVRVEHPYLLRSRLYCGVCDRRMQAQRSHGSVYYRCRFPQEYALANRVKHPRNVYVAERDLIGPLDTWLGKAFAPANLDRTISSLHDAQPEPETPDDDVERVLADCDRKLARHRAALEAGADPTLVAGWMAEVQAQRAATLAQARKATGHRRMSKEEIRTMIAALGNIRLVLDDADPRDKAEVYQKLDLRLTYQPGAHKVQAEANVGLAPRGVMGRVRGGT